MRRGASRVVEQASLTTPTCIRHSSASLSASPTLACTNLYLYELLSTDLRSIHPLRTELCQSTYAAAHLTYIHATQPHARCRVLLLLLPLQLLLLLLQLLFSYSQDLYLFFCCRRLGARRERGGVAAEASLWCTLSLFLMGGGCGLAWLASL